MDPIAVVTADNHFRPTTWAKHPDLQGDSYHGWREVIRYCLDNHLPLIQLGDLFDKRRPDPLSVSEFMSSMDLMQAADLPAYFIRGNHDFTDPPWFTMHDWPQHGIGQFHLNGITFYGLDYTPRSRLADELAQVPIEAHFVLTHQSWREIQSIGLVDGEASMFPRGVRVLTGDFHVTGHYTGPAANGDPVDFYSPGSTAMQSLGENPNKYLGVVRQSNRVDWEQIRTRGYMEAHIMSQEHLDNIVRELPTSLEDLQENDPDDTEIAKPIVRMKYADNLPDALARLETAVGDKGHLFAEPVRVAQDVAVDTAIRPADAFAGLVSAVGELQQPGTPLHDNTVRLLEAMEVAEEYDRIFEEFMA